MSDLFSSGMYYNIHEAPATGTDVFPPYRTDPSRHTDRHTHTGRQTDRHTGTHTGRERERYVL